MRTIISKSATIAGASISIGLSLMVAALYIEDAKRRIDRLSRDLAA